MQSPTVTRILEKPAIRAFQILVKLYGIQSDIYKPLYNKPKNDLHGFYDNDIEYEEVPYLQIKVLIPSLFRRRQSSNLSVLDPFLDSDTYLYVPNSTELKLFSLVVCRMTDKRILNYRIQNTNPVSNDAGIIINRYSIVPVLSSDIRKNINEIKHNLEKELEAFESGESVTTSMTDYNKNTANNLHYKKIE